MTFRYDIGLLRAIAVCFVLLYHFDIPFFGGGYIGVDIFFVISGFLMTKIILIDVGKNRFSYVDFIGRRIKRIVPALVGVAAFILILLPLLYFDVDMKLNAKYIALSLAFVSNIYYATLSGDYFSPDYQDNLFLHSWSLSVEWQFYVIYPVVLLILKRWYLHHFKYFRFIMIGLAMVSFIGGLYWTGASSWMFYMMPTRAWEFLLGGLAFLYSKELRFVLKHMLIPIVAVCLFLLIASAIFLGIQYAWPSPMVLIPTLATAGLLALDQQFPWYKIRWIQFLGKISYSLYLWHWPVYVLFQKYEFLMPSTYEIFVPLFFSFFFAILSYYLLEKEKKDLNIRYVAVMGTFVGVFALVLFLFPKNAIWNKTRLLDSSYIAYFQYDEHQHLNPCNCYITRSDRYDIYNKEICLKIDTTKDNILLMGDSHAAQLSTALRNTLTKKQNLLEMSLSLTFPFPEPKGYDKSVDLWRFFYQEFLPKNHADISKVFISVHWLMHTYAEMKYTPVQIKKGLKQIMGIFDQYGVEYYFIGQTESYRVPYRQVALKRMFNSALEEEDFTIHEGQQVNDFMKRNIPSPHYIDIYNNKEINHNSEKEMMPYMYDRHHLSAYGARQLVNYLVRHNYL